MTSTKLLCTALIVTAFPAAANTTRINSEFLAFRPAEVFAVKSSKSGDWSQPGYSLTLGLKGDTFIVDALKASGAVPSDCRQRFELDTTENKPSAGPVPFDYVARRHG